MTTKTAKSKSVAETTTKPVEPTKITHTDNSRNGYLDMRRKQKAAAKK